MKETTIALNAKQGFILIVGLTLLTNIVILLDVPFLRQTLGFLFYSLAPGWLFLLLLRLDKISFWGKVALSVGLSIAFLMLFGLVLNQVYFALGYATPLSTISLVVSFGVTLLLVAIAVYKSNNDAFRFKIPAFNLTTEEKALLIVPAILPPLSSLGMHLMNTRGNNLILLFTLLLVAAYVIFVAFRSAGASSNVYPIAIILMSLSLVLIFALRSNHIIGADAPLEYGFFEETARELHWKVRGPWILDASIAISLLPTVYHSLLGGNDLEYLFKLLCPLIFFITPLIIYEISRKQIQNEHAFLASILFMSQIVSLRAGYFGRSSWGILFFALAMMVLFSDTLGEARKRGLFIIFILATAVSYYTLTSIFFLIVLLTWLTGRIARRRVTRGGLTATISLLFFAFIFLWYSQMTEVPFHAAIEFARETIANLGNFLLLEFREGQVQTALGLGFGREMLPVQILVVCSWSIIILVALGILRMLRRWKDFNFEYLTITLLCFALLVAVVVLPFIGEAIGVHRVYAAAMVVLSTAFVLGGVTVSRYLKTKPCVILLVTLIPYFLSTTGVLFQLFGIPKDITLNSRGDEYNQLYISEQDAQASRWLGNHRAPEHIIFVDAYGRNQIIILGHIPPPLISAGAPPESFLEQAGYVYLRSYNVTEGLWLTTSDEEVVFREHFSTSPLVDRIYSNGNSEVWKSKP